MNTVMNYESIFGRYGGIMRTCELKKEGILEDHLIVSTNKLLRDHEPITPYTLDEVSKVITKTALRLLDGKDD